jgi:hypothetical protein
MQAITTIGLDIAKTFEHIPPCDSMCCDKAVRCHTCPPDMTAGATISPMHSPRPDR